MRLLEPMACASLGSVEAAVIAKHRGWAINLGGGFHHARRDDGQGFCVYPDITFVTHYMEKWFGFKKFMIIDLDAHQGNGHARDHMDKTKFYVFDMYNHRIFPGDQYAKEAISMDIDAAHHKEDTSYMEVLRRKLPESFDDFEPDFVIYNAGTDCMEGDRLGRMELTA